MHSGYCETPTKNISENKKVFASDLPYGGRVNLGIRLKKEKIT